MSVPSQNSCLREYVNNKNGTFMLPFLESSFDNCFHQLFGLARVMNAQSNILMYSVTMLPPEKKLNEFLDICSKKEINLCFILENFVSFRPYSDLKNEIQTYKLKNLENNLTEEK